MSGSLPAVLAHHPVFSQFQVRAAEDIPDGYRPDSFLGTIFRSSYVNVPSEPATPHEWREDTSLRYFESYPSFSEEYFEWIDLLESVVAASGSYTFIELGAGFGRWSARAVAAARQHGIAEVHLIAVEPEDHHFSWLEEHLATNGVDASSCVLIHAAISATDGTVRFAAGPRSQDQVAYLPDRWYGQAIDCGRVWKRRARRVLTPRRVERPGYATTTVPCVSPARIFEHCEVADLVDMDLQGAELDVVSAGIGDFNDRVRRLHVGTHSEDIEARLRSLLRRNGWELLADWPMFSKNETPFGTAYFNDGIQSWRNPRLS